MADPKNPHNSNTKTTKENEKKLAEESPILDSAEKSELPRESTAISGEPTSVEPPAGESTSVGESHSDFNPSAADIKSVLTPEDIWGKLSAEREAAELKEEATKQAQKPIEEEKQIGERKKSQEQILAPIKKRDLHPKINKKDLKETGGLLTPIEIEVIKKYFSEHKNITKLSKKETGKLIQDPRITSPIAYSAIRGTDSKNKETLYSLYRGKEKSLGKGAFGRVKIAQNLETGEWVAVKIQTLSFNTEEGKEKDKKILEKEKIAIEMEAGAEHAVGKGISKKAAFNIKEKAKDKKGVGYIKGYTFLKLLFGKPLGRQAAGLIDDLNIENMERERNNEAPIKIDQSDIISDFDEKLDVAILAVEELKKMHDKNVINRDIKPDNIMYDRKTKELSLIDLGLAINLDTKTVPSDTVDGVRCYTDLQSVGTPSYMSPEIKSMDTEGIKFRGASADEGQFPKYSKKSDIYAMGILLQKDIKLLANSNEIGPYQKTLSDLLKQMTLPDRKDIHKRPDAADVLKTLKEVRRKIQEYQIEEIKKPTELFKKYANSKVFADFHKTLVSSSSFSTSLQNIFESNNARAEKIKHVRDIPNLFKSLQDTFEKTGVFDLAKLQALKDKLVNVLQSLKKEGPSANKSALKKICKEFLADLNQLNPVILKKYYPEVSVLPVKPKVPIKPSRPTMLFGQSQPKASDLEPKKPPPVIPPRSDKPHRPTRNT